MKKFGDFCKHPLVLLLVGSALSYLLIPWITDSSSHKRVLQEERVERAVDVLKQGLIDDQKLISMVNLFEMFNKEAAADPTTSKTAQAELKVSFDKQYLEFDQHAWWWGHDLPVQSGLLELPPGSKQTIESLNYEYGKNLLDAVKQIDVLRVRFSGKNYAPGDPHNAEVLLAARRALGDLANARGGITSHLAAIFMPPGRTW
jgi:hypothetical protein